MNRPPEDYRNAPFRCAACHITMDRLQRKDAVVDVCSSCGGVWIDWYDGDAVGLLQGLSSSGGSLPGSQASECPRCQGALVVDRFRGDGPDVARCNQCFGVFVPGDSVEIMAALSRNRSLSGEDQPGGIAALGRWLERVLWKGD